jgi:biopolymer transport protein ExbD
MGASLSSAASKQQPSPEINVTPLVDVCLVLLIIFMVVAPAIADGAHIELPKVEAADPKTKDPNAIELGMAADGTLLLEKKPVAAKDLVTKVTELHKQDEGRSILLNVDKDVKYKKVRETFAQMQQIGFRGVLLKVGERKKPGDT